MENKDVRKYMKIHRPYGVGTFVVVLLTFLCAGAEADDDARDRASKAFKEGNQAYIQKDYAKAAKLFTQAHTLQPHDRVLYYIALAYDNLGDTERALDYLRRYAKTGRRAAEEAEGRIERTRRALHWRSVDRASLYVSKAFAKASGSETSKERTRRARLEGMLKRRGPVIDDIPFGVLTDPPGVQVYVDDRSMGPVATTPVTLRLEPGQHTIWLERPFHEGFQMKVNVQEPQPGRPPQKIHTQLERREVRVSLRAPSKTDEILFIGQGSAKRQSLGFGAWKGTLPAGQSVFAVRGQDGRQKLFRHTLDGDALMSLTLSEDDVEVPVVKTGSKLVLRGETRAAEVWVDGRKVGRLPGRYEVDVEPGELRVEVRRRGFRTWSTSVQIKAQSNEVLRLPERLRPLETSSSGGAWALVGLGILSGAGGGAITILDQQGQVPTENQSALRGISYGLYGVAGAGILGGMIWGLSSGSSEPASASRSWFWVIPEEQGARVQAGWTFE